MPSWMYIFLIVVIVYTLVNIFIQKNSNQKDREILKKRGMIAASAFFTVMLLIPIMIIAIFYAVAIKGTNFIFEGQFSGAWGDTLAIGIHLAITLFILSFLNKPINSLINHVIQSKRRNYIDIPFRLLIYAIIIYFTFFIFPYMQPKSFLYCLFLAVLITLIDIIGTSWIQKQETTNRKRRR